MKFTALVSGCVLLVSLSACSIKHPQTAAEFRQAAPGAFMAKMESYEVNRPFKKVASTFKKQAPKCLSARIRSESRTNMSYQVIVTKYNPTVIVKKNKAELHLQQLHEKGVMNISKVPEKGYFLMVVDATPISKNKTKIDYYGPSSGFDTITRAIRNWATGKNMGCPDLTR